MNLTAYFANLGDTVRHYDNGVFVSNLGNGPNTFYWGIRFPEGTLAGHDSLFKVMMYSYYSGDYDLAIYQGGDTVPGTLIANKTVSLPSIYDWELITLDNPIALNHTQPLWIVFHTEDLNYPAAASDYAGNRDGSWVSEDGVEWDFLGDFGLNVTFMIRAVLEDIVPFTFYNITAQSANISMGTVSGDTVVRENHYATLYATALPDYRFVGWNDGSFENPHYVLATGDMVLTAYFADLGGSEHHYDNGVRAYSLDWGSIDYGIRFPAGELADYDTLTGVRIWNVTSQELEVLIYTGGNDAPGTLVHSQNILLTGGDSTWFDLQLTTPIALNHTQPLWIVVHGEDGTIIPASYYAGNPEGSWYKWYDYWYHIGATWMIRAMLSGGEIDHYYTITATSSNPDHGHVIGGGTYLEGSMVGLLAEASPHYHFTQWSDGATANPRIFIITCDTTFTAHFAADMYTITVESMQPEMGTVTPSNSYAYGTVIQIEANPYSGYEFVSWNDANTDNPRTLVVTADSTFIAQFQPYTGIEDITSAEMKAYCVDGQIVVTGVSGMSVDILDMTGKLVARAQASDADRQVFKVTATGIYMVRAGDGTVLKVSVVR